MEEKKLYVLDTNVLIHDPEAMSHFEENTVIIPLTVIEELDKLKKGFGETSFSARQATRNIEGLRQQGNLLEGVRLKSGGMVKGVLSSNGRTPDEQIIMAAIDLKKQHGGTPVFLVSKDVNVRIKLEYLSSEVKAEDYRFDKAHIEEAYGKILGAHSVNGVKAYRYFNEDDKLFRFRENNISKVQIRSVFGIIPADPLQKCLLDALLCEDIDVVAVTGKAGTGKTLLALAAGLELHSMENKSDRVCVDRVLVTRANIPIGNDHGYLPGEMKEKIRPLFAPIQDNLDVLIHQKSATDKKKKGAPAKSAASFESSGIIQFEPLAYIRGRSLPRLFFIVDEAQNLRPIDVKTILTRCGQGSKVVLTGDLEQIDTPYLDRTSNGLAYIISRFMKGYKKFAYIHLEKTVRSELAEAAAQLL